MKILSSIVSIIGFMLLAGTAGSSDIGTDLGSLLPYIIIGLVLMIVGGIGYHIAERRNA